LNPKELCRKQLLKKRNAISSQRREEAAFLLKESFTFQGTILSFTSIGSEIDTKLLNEFLAKENRLILVPYKPDALFNVSLKDIDCILVPGLGFDQEKHRIGYGQGWYDRFLSSIGNILTVGVGFKEQFCEKLLPRDPWDIPLEKLLLV
jgi:5-formyltetrahydrofolate cyclo-ligase